MAFAFARVRAEKAASIRRIRRSVPGRPLSHLRSPAGGDSGLLRRDLGSDVLHPSCPRRRDSQGSPLRPRRSIGGAGRRTRPAGGSSHVPPAPAGMDQIHTGLLHRPGAPPSHPDSAPGAVGLHQAGFGKLSPASGGDGRQHRRRGAGERAHGGNRRLCHSDTSHDDRRAAGCSRVRSGSVGGLVPRHRSGIRRGPLPGGGDGRGGGRERLRRLRQGAIGRPESPSGR